MEYRVKVEKMRRVIESIFEKVWLGTEDSKRLTDNHNNLWRCYKIIETNNREFRNKILARLLRGVEYG